MLLRFRFANHRSFRDESEIIFVASNLQAEHAIGVEVGQGRSEAVLPAVGIFGSNASGKSNVIRALWFMRSAVRSSHSSWKSGEPIPVDPFRLDADSAQRPSLFEVDFVEGGQRYQYGFELNADQILAEWLYSYPFGRRRVLFERDGEKFEFGKDFRGPNKAVVKITRTNSLYLSAALASEHDSLSAVASFFANGLWISRTRQDQGDLTLTNRLLSSDGDAGGKVRALLRYADVGIEDAVVRNAEVTEKMMGFLSRIVDVVMEREDEDETASEQRRQELLDVARSRQEVHLVHSAEKQGTTIPFDQESLGTQSWYALIGPILVCLEGGSTLVVDELDASLHPMLLAQAIALFQDRELNKLGAQLVFTAHDTTPVGTLLGEVALGREQVWLTEKDRAGSSHLTPISDFSPRKGENLQRGYLQGRYGGTPRLRPLALKAAFSDALAEDE